MLAALGVVTAVWQARPRISEEEVRDLVITRIQSEAPAAFLVTGTLDLTATTTVSSTRYLLPRVLDLSLGTSRATVRVPARVAYGFDVRNLRAEMITVRGDSLIEVALPALRVFSVEPSLTELEVETERGWARIDPSTLPRLERRALANIETGLRTQADAHLRDAAQPRINTGRALDRLLRPVLSAAGLENVQLEFEITRELELRPRG